MHISNDKPDFLPAIDVGRTIDWGKTSEDYAQFRPGPPISFYNRLAALGVGLNSQKILDLGTGTGILARQFALQGSNAAGIDISEGQIEVAKKCAIQDNLKVDFKIGSAEEIPFPNNSFDVIHYKWFFRQI